jgi:glyoxylase-like metal-dependent hydrolase (beta-lactamase superfamily II)
MMNISDLAPLVVGSVSTNCWVVPLGQGEAAVIDPGGEAERIVARLEELRSRPAYILLTHGHFDHLAALPDLSAAFSGGDFRPVIGIHEEDALYVGRDARRTHMESFRGIPGGASLIQALWKPMPEAGVLFADGDRAGPFTVMHTPGHTPGSCVFFWPEEQILFSGDTLFAEGFGRTDLPGGDEAKLAGSIKRLFDMDGGVRVLPGHGEVTTIGAERRYYRFS